jgi:hypothetical protein
MENRKPESTQLAVDGIRRHQRLSLHLENQWISGRFAFIGSESNCDDFAIARPMKIFFDIPLAAVLLVDARPILR